MPDHGHIFFGLGLGLSLLSASAVVLAQEEQNDNDGLGARQSSAVNLARRMVGHFKERSARCFALIADSSFREMGRGLRLDLPMIMMSYEADEPNTSNAHGDTDYQSMFGEQARFPCPFFLFAMENIFQVESFLQDNPSFKKNNLGHFAIILRETYDTEKARELLFAPFFSHAADVVLFMPPATNGPGGRTVADDFVMATHDISSLTERRVSVDAIWKGGDMSFVTADGGAPSFYPDKLSDLKGQVFKAATFMLPPFTFNVNGQLSGFEVRTFNTIAQALNFRYTVEMVKGTWNGLVQHLHHERALFGWAHFFLTLDRSLLIDFTQSFDTDYYCFLVAKPAELPKWMSLIFPLSWEVWLGTAVMLLICLTFTLLYSLLYPRPELPWDQGLIFVFGAFVDETHTHTQNLSANGIRTFAAFFLFCSFILTTGYRGSLVSFLTAPYTPRPLDTLQEVVDSPMPVASIGNVIKKDLAKAKEPLYQRFDEKYRLQRELNLTMNGAFQKAKNRELIMYENKQMLQFRIRKDFTNKFGETNFHLAHECSKPFNICFGLPKNSPFTRSLGRVIVRLKESGIIKKFFTDEMDAVAKVATKTSKTSDTNEPLTMYNLQGAFIVQMIGLGLSVLAFAGEFIIGRPEGRKGENRESAKLVKAATILKM